MSPSLAADADDFAALTAVLDAVSDCSDNDSSSSSGAAAGAAPAAEQSGYLQGGALSPRRISVQNRMYDEALELNSVVSSRDSDDEDAQLDAVTPELPMGGMPCVAVLEQDDSMYDDLDVSEEVRALFSHCRWVACFLLSLGC